MKCKEVLIVKYKLLVLVLAIAFTIVAGSVWHKDDQYAAGLSDTPVVSGSVVKPAPDSSANEGQTKNQAKLIAYYYHGNVRCATCRRIEAYTKEAIDSAFADQLKSGALEWHVVNIDSAQNKHFVDDYQLYTRSVVLANLRDGKQVRWKNLDKIWTLVRNKPEFAKYIQSEVKLFLDPTK